MLRSLVLGCLLLVGIPLGCQSISKTIRPSNRRDWQPDQAKVAFADIQGDIVNIHNIRNCRYVDDNVYVTNYYDRRLDLNSLQTVDFIICPFTDTPDLAHTMLSFGYVEPDGTTKQLAVSVEIRKERGEEYAAWKGSTRQYELMYVLADERDVIGVRVNHRDEEVYLYRSVATKEQAKELFLDVLQRVNKLAQKPEFYDSLTNNCTNNIVRHINRLRPGRIAPDIRILLPGHSDKLAYDLNLIEKPGTFEETREHAHINAKAKRYARQVDYSALIRR